MQDQVIRIKAQRGWQFGNIRELLHYRDLLYFLTIRGIKAKYAQSVLGVGWAIIQPLMSTLVFTIVFGRIARVGSEGVPYFLFSLVALVPWTYFSSTVSESANSLIQNSAMISKVYFPRIVLPFAAAMGKTLDFLIGFILLVVFLICYRMPVRFDILLFPVLLFILVMTSLGLGLILSAMSVQFRDVRHALTFMMQLIMYAAPVVYPTTNVPEKFRIWYALNPMVGVIEGFRAIFLHTQPLPVNWIVEGAGISLLLFVFGMFYFHRMERSFADLV